MFERALWILEQETFAQTLGVQRVEIAQDRVVARLPYRAELGEGRVHGGAISALVDITATACFWADAQLTENARGATVGFTINFLSLVVATDLTAHASIRRRGGTLCTGDVSIRNPEDVEVATAIVTYKLNR